MIGGSSFNVVFLDVKKKITSTIPESEQNKVCLFTHSLCYLLSHYVHFSFHFHLQKLPKMDMGCEIDAKFKSHSLGVESFCFSQSQWNLFSFAPYL